MRRAVRGSSPNASSARAVSSTVGASNRTSWQRERIVGSTSASRSDSRIRCTNDAGSSSVFSIRLAASSPNSSTRSITNTRHAASKGVLLAADMTGPAMSLTSISWAPLGATHVRSGCAPEATLARALAGSGEPAASSSPAIARAADRLPAPPGP